MLAEYISNNSFRVLGDESSNFVINRRVKLDCGVDGFVIASIDSSLYDSTYTNIVINEDTITTNLEGVLYSVVKPGSGGNIPNHNHSTSEGEGGEIDIPMELISLIDTPSTYFGTEGYYLQSTGSGTIWAEISETGGGSSDVQSFLDLNDSPTTYSGTENYYLKSTGSGIVFQDLLLQNRSIFLEDTWPTGVTIGDLFINQTNNTIYEKTQEIADGARKFWRLYIDLNNNSSYCEIASFELRATVGGVDQAYGSGGVATESQVWTPGYEGSKAFDNNVATFWITSIVNPCWLQFEFPSAVLVRQIALIPRVTYGAYMPRTFTLQASLDGVVWEDAESWTDITSWTNAGLEFSVSELPSRSGWDIVLTVPNSLLDLNDTPTTYSGTDGQFLQSTGSGVVWAEIAAGGGDVTSEDLTTLSGVLQNQISLKQDLGNYAVWPYDRQILPIINPSAETGNTIGWVDISGNMDVKAGGFDGAYYFFGGANAVTESYQEVTLISGAVTSDLVDSSTAELVVDFYANSYNADTDSIKTAVVFYNSLGVALNPKIYSEEYAYDNWTLVSNAYNIPTMARYFRLYFYFTRYSGTNNDGYIDAIVAYVPVWATQLEDITDVPVPVSGNFLKRKDDDSGYEWATISGGGTSDVRSFLDLSDTPSFYTEGQYLRTTTSGIEAIDGIILKAPNESEWIIKVTNSGTLYTEAI